MSYENGTMEYEKYHTYDEAGAGTTDADKAQRRERIATAILAGIHANAACVHIDYRMAAKCAIYGAEALIAELDRNK